MINVLIIGLLISFVFIAMIHAVPSFLIRRDEKKKMDQFYQERAWSRLKAGAAEYDRLRDKEFRELGWTGKY